MYGLPTSILYTYGNDVHASIVELKDRNGSSNMYIVEPLTSQGSTRARRLTLFFILPHITPIVSTIIVSHTIAGDPVISAVDRPAAD